jgi:NCAIR mutase (PurE)-related protein
VQVILAGYSGCGLGSHPCLGSSIYYDLSVAADAAAAAAGVTGRFPRLWAGLTSLQVLNLPGTAAHPCRFSLLLLLLLLLCRRHWQVSLAVGWADIPARVTYVIGVECCCCCCAGVTGRFPRLWAGLTSLQVLDVSGTGVVSELPHVWASLQQLQVSGEWLM